jgi:hypothetical protein
MLNNLKAGYKIILDEDPEESGMYAVNDWKICKLKSFPFKLMSEHSNLETEQIMSQHFGKMTGYQLCHQDWATAQTGISGILFFILCRLGRSSIIET